MVVDRRLSAGHARALLAVEDGPEQEQLADRIVAEELTVRETEEAVRRLVAAHFAGDDAGTDRPQVPARPAALLELEQLLSELLDTKVQVTMGGRRGKVVVDFATIEDLERIYRVIIEGKPTVE
jgi:ParB family chromosome partitioning protein